MGFKNSGLYGMSVPKKYGGAELFFTEIGRWEQYTNHTVQFDVFRYYEELGDSPALTEILAANESLGVSSLLAAGSQEIKTFKNLLQQRKQQIIEVCVSITREINCWLRE